MMPWGVEALAASSLLIAAVLAVRAPMRRRFGARVAYALWALPALRLLLPPLPPLWRALHPALAPLPGVPTQVLVLEAGSAAGYPVPPPAAPALVPGPWLPDLLLGVWAAGAVAFLLWQLSRYRRFARALRADAEHVATLDGVELIRSPFAQGPLALGVWRRVVAVPFDWSARVGRPERELALAHELAHHERRDLVANWVALGVLAAHWWNPLAWAGYRAFRADQELATDAHVLATRGGDATAPYARAIVAAAAGRGVSPVCHLNSIADLKRRLTMLTAARPSRRRLFAGAALAASLTLIGLGATASTAQEAPLPPIPPVAPVAPMPSMETMPSMAAMPSAAPAAPPAPLAPRHYRHVTTAVRNGDHAAVIIQDGRTVATVPEIASRRCGPGKPDVLHERAGRSEVIVICEDRIAAATERAAGLAANGARMQRVALDRAAEGLERAKADLAANREMMDADRARALAAITQAQAEIARSQARMD